MGATQTPESTLLVLDEGYFYRAPILWAGSLQFANISLSKARFWHIVSRGWVDEKGIGHDEERASIVTLDMKLSAGAAADARKKDLQDDRPPVPAWHKTATAIGEPLDRRPRGQTAYAVEIPKGFELTSSSNADEELDALIKKELASYGSDHAVIMDTIISQRKLSATFAHGLERLWYVSSGNESLARLAIYYSPDAKTTRTRIASFDFITACDRSPVIKAN